MMMIMWKFGSFPRAHQGLARQERAAFQKTQIQRGTLFQRLFGASYEVDFNHADDMWESQCLVFAEEGKNSVCMYQFWGILWPVRRWVQG